MLRVANIALGQPFLPTLIAGLLDRDDLADLTLLLPSRRACLSARETFQRASGGATLLLPRLLPVGEPDEAELALSGTLELALPPVMPPLRRRLLLMRLVRASARDMPHEQAVRLAAELERFIDELHNEEVDLAGLDHLVPSEFAEHWQESLTFLGLLRTAWPAVLAAENRLEATRRRRLLLDAVTAEWRARPPVAVVAAGISGTIPAVGRLLATVARLPGGQLVLHGLDRSLDQAAWDAVDPVHPQYGLKRLLERVDVAREAVADWPVSLFSRAALAARGRLWTAAMLPANQTDGWRHCALPPEAVVGIEIDVAPDPAAEALRIALRLREALTVPGRRAALITPSRSLGRRVAAELLRWDIVLDDSAGLPLDQTPPGGFLLLTALLATADVTPADILSVLKHPLAAAGMPRAKLREQVRRLELAVMRGPRRADGLRGLATAVAELAEADGLRAWLHGIMAAAAPLASALASGDRPLTDLLALHFAFAEWLAADEAGDPAELWAREAGRCAMEFMTGLAEAGDAAGEVPASAYPAILAILMASVNVRPDRPAHPRLTVLGQLEGRLVDADLVILGGLNEGTWPPALEAGPWLNRAMRAGLGLPPGEQASGIAAQDFLAAAAAPEVVLSRAAKDEGGTPTVASRWLVRLRALLEAAGAEPPARPEIAAWAAGLDQPGGPPRPVPRPEPRPPLAARPRELSVSDIERLMRDPYAVYAYRILGLKALAPLDADPGGAERGEIIHAVLDEFVREWARALPEDPVGALRAIGRSHFGKLAAQPQVAAMWWPRFLRVADWFAEVERRRRADAARVAAEVKGRTTLDLPGGPFTLKARADRIEIGRDGRLTIVDYKTGPVPSDKDVQLGLSPQLTIEAMIAERGGFAAVGPASAATLLYMQLKGSEAAPGTEVERAGDDLRRLIDEAAAGVERLIAHFDDPATAYLPVPLPEIAPSHSDYDHLARAQEWLGTEGEA
ncbi:MAG: double-strand break repair protein AddB [Geminicoccaceae bacterium]